MKNREWLQSMAVYDLLCRISDYGEMIDKEHFCIVDALEGNGAYCTGKCRECLQVWLNLNDERT